MDGVGVGKETVVVGDIDYMAKSIAVGNPNRLTGCNVIKSCDQSRDGSNQIETI